MAAAQDPPEKGADRPHPPAFGAAIPTGLGLNLLVVDVDRAARWQAEVLGARVLYWEEHFAVLSAAGATWFLHSDWSYRGHPLRGAVDGVEARGAGAEFRLYGIDPDAAEARAVAAGATVLSAATDKPHGLREAHLVDPEGYVWAPCVPIPTPG
ncbi:MAG TPA: VOC family protein [Paracoccaceae bacterium]|nr:VOC family protein [Paracoccaceae bacterium]